MSSDPAAGAEAKVSKYSWYVLFVLTAIYVLNFLDRQVIYILFRPIKAEMHFTDLQLALLGTTSFVIFYTLLGVPFGRLADRVSRTKLIACGLAVWSLFSGLTGFADSFWTLFFCRLMVGVGEATLGPAALSLLSDYFPPRMGRAMAGDGRSTCWIFPGLLLAVIAFFLREPPRGRTEVAAVRYRPEDWKVLFRSVPLRYLYLGYAIFGLAANNLGIWGAAFFVRVHHLSLARIGLVAGILGVVVGIPMTILGGYLADRFRRSGPGGRMAFIAWSALASIPLWLGLLFVDQIGVVVLLSIPLYGLALMWVAPATADLHEIAGPHLRGLGIGIFFSTVNIVAYGLGAPLIGKLNDRLGVTANPENMRLALLICPAACALAAILLWRGSRARAAGAEG